MYQELVHNFAALRRQVAMAEHDPEILACDAGERVHFLRLEEPCTSA
jgi:hypothetical protein